MELQSKWLHSVYETNYESKLKSYRGNNFFLNTMLHCSIVPSTVQLEYSLNLPEYQLLYKNKAKDKSSIISKFNWNYKIHYYLYELVLPYLNLFLFTLIFVIICFHIPKEIMIFVAFLPGVSSILLITSILGTISRSEKHLMKSLKKAGFTQEDLDLLDKDIIKYWNKPCPPSMHYLVTDNFLISQGLIIKKLYSLFEIVCYYYKDDEGDKYCDIKFYDIDANKFDIIPYCKLSEVPTITESILKVKTNVKISSTYSSDYFSYYN